MQFFDPCRSTQFLVIGLACALSPAVHAKDKVDKIVNVGVQRNADAKTSQRRIDNIADASNKLDQEYKKELTVNNGLKIYNKLLQGQIDDQNSKLSQISSSIENVAVIQRQITPLMLRMLDSLSQFINMDVPFLLKERRDRVEKLKKTLTESDVMPAEKFRAVLQAYKIENQYGRTIETYKGSLKVSGKERQVDFLRIGRVALLYQSEGGKYNGFWDKQTRSWKQLKQPEYKNYIRKGIRIAERQVAPDLVMTPVSAPEEAK
jgi:hypothetical protein